MTAPTFCNLVPATCHPATWLFGALASLAACAPPDDPALGSAAQDASTDAGEDSGENPGESGAGLAEVPSGVVGGSTPLAAAIFYVSSAGNDAQSGSAAQPWRTIQHAADVAPSGSEVRVLPGPAYDERVTIRRSGLTFRGGGFGVLGRAVVDATSAPFAGHGPYHPVFRVVNADDITISDFVITNHADPEAVNDCPLEQIGGTAYKCPINMGVLVLGLGQADPYNPADFTPGELPPRNVVIARNRFTAIDRPTQGVGRGAIGVLVFGNTTDAEQPIHDVVIEDNEFSGNTLSADWMSNAVLLHANVADSVVRANEFFDFGVPGPNPHPDATATIAIEAAGNEPSLKRGAYNHARGIVIADNIILGPKTKQPGEAGEVLGIYVNGGQRVLVERNYIERAMFGMNVANERVGDESDYTAEVWLRDNIVTAGRQFQSVPGADLVVGDPTWSAASETLHNDCYRPVRDVYVTNNTFYTDAQAFDVPRVVLQAGIVGDSRFQNNIVHATYTALFLAERTSPPPPSPTSPCSTPLPSYPNLMRLDHNLYYGTHDPASLVRPRFTFFGSRLPWPTYFSQPDYDDNAAFAEPALFNPQSELGFTPVAGSPAVDAGQAVTPSWVTGPDHFGPYAGPIERDYYMGARWVGPGVPPAIDVGAAEVQGP